MFVSSKEREAGGRRREKTMKKKEDGRLKMGHGRRGTGKREMALR
jgi:hypothetical protein